MKIRLRCMAAVIVVFLATLSGPLGITRCLAQEPDQQTESARRGAQDPLTQLKLTPEQWIQIRMIRQQLQATAVNQRLRQANRALEAALDADDPDEVLIEQLLRDLSAAQGAQTRMRVLSELRIIRSVLTPEQRILLREIRLTRQLRRQRPLEEQRRPQDGADANRRLPNQRNGLRPRPN
jgi:Spy/CpxP family protein refolding chaperone